VPLPYRGIAQVEFCDATAPYCTDIHLLGTAQYENRKATLNLIPGVGSHSYKAVYIDPSTGEVFSSNTVDLTVTGTYSSTNVLTATGSAGNYTLTSTVTGPSFQALSGSVSFLDTTNANYALATANLGPSTTELSFVSAPPVPTGTLPNYVTSGDFNGDGKPDLAVANRNSNNVTILLGNGDGTFTPAAPLTGLSQPLWIAVADFNSDGNVDLAITTYGGAVSIYLGLGNGTFTATASIPTGLNANAIVSGDFNGDGIPDLAVANTQVSIPGPVGSLTVLLGKGDGTFAASTANIGIPPPSFLAVGDFNGDGKTDLVAANAVNAQVLLGGGDGTFAAGQILTMDRFAYGIAAADLNSDGKLDLAFAIESGSLVGSDVFFGNGDGTFTKTSAPGFDSISTALAVGDFNQDGYPDLAAPQDADESVYVALGSATGTLTDSKVTPATGANPVSIAVADFNGDGVTDIAVANSGDNDLTILLTRLTQTATVTVTGISPVGTGSHLIDAVYAGNTFYNSSTSNTVALTALPVPTNTSLTIAPPGSTVGQPVTLTAVVSPTFAQNHTAGGSVSFYGAYPNHPLFILLGTVPLTNGSAALPIASLPIGITNIACTYSGDTNFATSNCVTTGVPVTAIPDFSLTSANPTITLQTGHHGTLALALTSIGGFTGNVSIACAAQLPPYVTCELPSSLALSSAAAAPVPLTLDTDAVLNFYASQRPAAPGGSPIAFALALPFSLLGLAWGRTSRRRLPRALLALLPLCLLALGLTACNGYYPGSTPPGTYVIPVTATGTSQGSPVTNTHTLQVTLIVTP
jgi:hypothetical protein